MWLLWLMQAVVLHGKYFAKSEAGGGVENENEQEPWL